MKSPISIDHVQKREVYLGRKSPNICKGVESKLLKDRFDQLYQDFKKREKEESRASWVDVEYDEIYLALTNIHGQLVD